MEAGGFMGQIINWYVKGGGNFGIKLKVELGARRNNENYRSIKVEGYQNISRNKMAGLG